MSRQIDDVTQYAMAVLVDERCGLSDEAALPVMAELTAFVKAMVIPAATVASTFRCAE